MKVVLLTIFTFIAYTSFAQKQADNFMLGEIKYSAEDSIVTDSKNNTIHLYGKAAFENDKVHFTANKITIDKNSKKVIATGLLAVISTPMVKSNVNSKNTVLRYTIGENSVLIE